MKRIITTLAITTLLSSATFLTAADEIRTEGAAPGQWTMDLAAAKKVAAEKKLPILLDFSGSDWCGWCKLMEKNVFTKDAWKNYATNNIMMVLIDFPSDKTRVPEKFRERNETLQKTYSVRGFPTFIILDDDGKTVMGRLGAGRDKTPASFIGELKKLFRYRPCEVEKYTQTLDKETAKSYKAIIEEINQNKKEIQENKKIITEAQENIEKLTEASEDLLQKATEFRVKQKGEDQFQKYKQLKSQLEAAEKKLADWMDTDPVQNEANSKIFMKMSGEVSKLKSELSEY